MAVLGATNPKKISNCPKTAIKKSFLLRLVAYVVYHTIIKINKILFKILIVKIVLDFEPPPPKQNRARERPDFSEFPCQIFGKCVGGALHRPLLCWF